MLLILLSVPTAAQKKMAVTPLWRPTAHFMGCISVHEVGSHHSSHFVIPTRITLKCGFSIFPSLLLVHFEIDSARALLEKLESLLHRAMVAKDRKDLLGQAAAFLSPPCCSPEQVLFYLSFPSGNTATASPVKMLYSLSDLTSWEQFPKFRWHFLCYKLIQLFQITLSNAWFFFSNIAKIIFICLWYIPLSFESFWMINPLHIFRSWSC